MGGKNSEFDKRETKQIADRIRDIDAIIAKVDSISLEVKRLRQEGHALRVVQFVNKEQNNPMTLAKAKPCIDVRNTRYAEYIRKMENFVDEYTAEHPEKKDGLERMRRGKLRAYGNGFKLFNEVLNRAPEKTDVTYEQLQQLHRDLDVSVRTDRTEEARAIAVVAQYMICKETPPQESS